MDWLSKVKEWDDQDDYDINYDANNDDDDDDAADYCQASCFDREVVDGLMVGNLCISDHGDNEDDDDDADYCIAGDLNYDANDDNDDDLGSRWIG